MRIDPGFEILQTPADRQARHAWERGLTAFRDMGTRPRSDPMRVGDDPRLAVYQQAMMEASLLSPRLSARGSAEAASLARMAALRQDRRRLVGMSGDLIGYGDLKMAGAIAVAVLVAVIAGSFGIVVGLERLQESYTPVLVRRRRR
jgi:hypothetical protein